VDVEDLVARVRRNVGDLEHKLAKERAFLAELELRVQGDPAQSSPVIVMDEKHEGGLRRVPRREKAKVSRGLIEAAPGEWSTVRLRKALQERGIDADAGTPVKNILYSFVNDDGWGEAHGGGIYRFPAPQNGTAPTQGGLGV
jgi:hypothetical protein